MRVGIAVLLGVALVLSAGCGEEGKPAKPDVQHYIDAGDTTDTGQDAVYGCNTAEECIGKIGEQLDQCQEVQCINHQCQVVPATGKPCDDGNPCTENDQCNAGVCQGIEKDCSDGNICTDDSCDPQTGQCVHTPNSAPCDDGNPCTSGDHCENGVCVGGESICECQTDEDCAKYDDGDKCNGVLKCVDNKCQVDPDTIVDCSGIDPGECKEVYCDPADGQCKTKNVEDGTPCNDNNACTHSEKCQSGVCVGMPVDCDDGNPCTNDSCDPEEGCVYEPVPDGTECSDGSLCTENDHCENGKCVGDPVEGCESCESDADCEPYDDGNLCNGILKCIDGKCQVDPSTIVQCGEPSGPCKEVKCNPETGKCEESNALDGTPCDDNNACTESDACVNGECKGIEIDCDDNNPCTKDTCDPEQGCVHEPIEGECDDGDPCTINDQCQDGQCIGEPNPECQCNTDEDCVQFDDGNLCNGILVCVDHKCVLDPDSVVDCEVPGLDPCMVSECEPETGYCVLKQLPNGTECDDGNACTEGDTCYDGNCLGTSVNCDDGNICTDDYCDPLIGCVHEYNNAPCDDGNPCTKNDKCQEGFCIGEPDPECICEKDEDCAPFEDGNLCNGTLICKNSHCVVDPSTIVVCDTSQDTDCLVTHCVPETGECVQEPQPDGKPCDDGNACTLADYCLNGECVGTVQKNCDDGNPCTDDYCDPEIGCVNEPNNAPCDDGDPCTGGDYCEDGVCHPGPENLCGEDTCKAAYVLSCGDTDKWNNGFEGSTDAVTEYACSPWTYEGPEYTYSFTAPYDATVTVSLSDETGETDIIVLENNGEGCDPNACRDYDFATVTFEAKAGESFFFVVDGYEGGSLPGTGWFTISVTCVPKHELNCSDGVDDDQDGLTDCDDEDCKGTPECPLPYCQPAWELTCDLNVDSWANYDYGSTDVIDSYSCNNFDYSGPEYAYTFLAPFSKTVTVKLSDETAETDILVIEDSDGVCDPQNCIAWGMNSVTFDTEEGKLYYIVVDGYMGAEGKYTITLECPPDVESVCDDGIDNDQDGKTDCQDPDCATSDACSDDCNPWLFPLWWPTVSCGDEIDSSNYGFTATNKADTYSCTTDQMTGPERSYIFEPDFDGSVTVTLSNETDETDILVVEADEEGDCITSNCIAWDYEQVTFNVQAGKRYFIIVDGYNGAKGNFHMSVSCTPAQELNCTDGKDDDQDGFVDCEDSDCFPGPDCEPACEPDTVEEAQLTCGSSDSWSNDGAGSTNKITHYSCNSYEYSGPEYTYTLTVDEDTNVTVKLSNEVGSDGSPVQLDILVLEDKGLGCNPASCITYGFDEVTFQAKAGTTYYIVIDGYLGDTGSYDLEVTCSE